MRKLLVSGKTILQILKKKICDASEMSSKEALYWSLLEINFLLHFFSLKSDTEETNTDI